MRKISCTLVLITVISRLLLSQVDSVVYLCSRNDYSGEMILYSDSTFKYSYQVWLMQATTTGTWRLDERKRYFILNSNAEILTDSVVIIERKDINSDSISIKVVDFNNEPICFGALILNDTIFVPIDKNKCIYNHSMINMGKIRVCIFSNLYEKQIQDNKANVFIVKVFYNPYLRWYRYFTNEKWRRKRNKLIDPKGRIYKRIKNLN